MAKDFPTKKEWFDWARDQLHNIDKAKSDIIQQLARALEEWIPIEMISEEISRELADSGYISSSYVRLVLAEKYKNKKKQTSMSNSGETVLLNRDNGSANYSNKDMKKSSDSDNAPPLDYKERTREPHLRGIEIEVVEFDLKQAWGMGLKDHLLKSQKSNTQVWLIKLYVLNGLVRKIENEMSGFVKEDITV